MAQDATKSTNRNFGLLLQLRLLALGSLLGLSACPALPDVEDGSSSSERPVAHEHQPADEADGEALRSQIRRCIDLTVDVEQMLTEYCAGCHADGNRAGGFDSLLDVAKLVASSKIVPGNPDASKLYVLVRDGVMPRSEHKPSPAEVDMLRDWIRCGAAAFEIARDDFE